LWEKYEGYTLTVNHQAETLFLYHRHQEHSIIISYLYAILVGYFSGIEPPDFEICQHVVLLVISVIVPLAWNQIIRVRPLRTISCAKWQNNGIAVLLSEQWAGIVAEPGREGRLCAVRVQICQTFR
jgi:hypothetical protein